MSQPKPAMCNFIPDVDVLKKAAMAHGFSGVDWTFKPEDLPTNGLDESRLLGKISRLHPLEVHRAFKGIDFGDADEAGASAAMETHRKVCRMVSRLEDRFMTVHLGLGSRSTGELSWERGIEAMTELVEYADDFGICLCLENPASGWSSPPELFEKLIRKSRAGVTLDITMPA